MSFFRRLVIQTDYKILVTEGDEIWFLAWLLNCCVVTELIVFSELYTKNKNKKKSEENGATVFYQRGPMVGVHWVADCVMQ